MFNYYTNDIPLKVLNRDTLEKVCVLVRVSTKAVK